MKTTFSRTSRRGLTGTVALLAAVFALVPLSTSAGAAEQLDHVYVTGADLAFIPTGEHLYLSDTAADGHHVEGYYLASNGNGVTYHFDNYGGNGSSYYRDLSIPESGWIRISVCTMEGSNYVACSGYKQFSANG